MNDQIATVRKGQVKTVELLLVRHLLAPRRLEALELLHVASIEGVECVDEPLLVCVPEGLQHRMHQLQTHISRQQSGCGSDAGDDSHPTAGSTRTMTYSRADR